MYYLADYEEKSVLSKSLRGKRQKSWVENVNLVAQIMTTGGWIEHGFVPIMIQKT